MMAVTTATKPRCCPHLSQGGVQESCYQHLLAKYFDNDTPRTVSLHREKRVWRDSEWPGRELCKGVDRLYKDAFSISFDLGRDFVNAVLEYFEGNLKFEVLQGLEGVPTEYVSFGPSCYVSSFFRHCIYLDLAINAEDFHRSLLQTYINFTEYVRNKYIEPSLDTMRTLQLCLHIMRRLYVDIFVLAILVPGLVKRFGSQWVRYMMVGGLASLSFANLYSMMPESLDFDLKVVFNFPEGLTHQSYESIVADLTSVIRKYKVLFEQVGFEMEVLAGKTIQSLQDFHEKCESSGEKRFRALFCETLFTPWDPSEIRLKMFGQSRTEKDRFANAVQEAVLFGSKETRGSIRFDAQRKEPYIGTKFATPDHWYLNPKFDFRRFYNLVLFVGVMLYSRGVSVPLDENMILFSIQLAELSVLLENIQSQVPRCASQPKGVLSTSQFQVALQNSPEILDKFLLLLPAEVKNIEDFSSAKDAILVDDVDLDTIGSSVKCSDLMMRLASEHRYDKLGFFTLTLLYNLVSSKIEAIRPRTIEANLIQLEAQNSPRLFKSKSGLSRELVAQLSFNVPRPSSLVADVGGESETSSDDMNDALRMKLLRQSSDVSVISRSRKPFS